MRWNTLGCACALLMGVGWGVTGPAWAPALGQDTPQDTSLRQELLQERQKSQRLERQLSDLLTETASQVVAAKQQVIDLRRALEEERTRAETLSRELQALRDGSGSKASAGAKAVTIIKGHEPPGAEERAVAEAQRERERADGLARDLAAARREIEVLTAIPPPALERVARDRQIQQLRQALVDSEVERLALLGALRDRPAAEPTAEPATDLVRKGACKGGPTPVSDSPDAADTSRC
jgi:DNA repair exonuclease SbcCD ATPase subunit